MKTKEEVIKEACGEHFDTVKHNLNETGWCVDKGHKLFHQHRIYDNDEDFDFVFDGYWDYNEVEKYRPKSLRGIENNNGWIRIESEADLPKEGNFWIRKSNGHITLMSVLVLKSIPKKRYSEITHYQPIVKPNKPLY